MSLGQVTVGPGDNQFNKQNTYQVRDTLSWAHGKHTFKFGGEYLHFIYPQFFLSRSNGDYWYSSLQPLINDQVADVGGRVLRGAGTGSFLGTQSRVYGFIQDDFKVTPRLTLNLGLRYEYWTNPLGSSTQSLNAISNMPGVIDFHNPTTQLNALHKRRPRSSSSPDFSTERIGSIPNGRGERTPLRIGSAGNPGTPERRCVDVARFASVGDHAAAPRHAFLFSSTMRSRRRA